MGEDLKAKRFDQGKAPMHLLPWDSLIELSRIYGEGAKKYGERNWEQGMVWSRVFNSLIRHAAAWSSGEDFDKESGQHHMLHCAWNALALATYDLRGMGGDDRYRIKTPVDNEKLYHTPLKPGMQVTFIKITGLWNITDILDESIGQEMFMAEDTAKGGKRCFHRSMVREVL